MYRYRTSILGRSYGQWKSQDFYKITVLGYLELGFSRIFQTSPYDKLTGDGSNSPWWQSGEPKTVFYYHRGEPHTKNSTLGCDKMLA
jgi:hypothetical protein